MHRIVFLDRATIAPHPNFILTLHIAGASEEAQQALADQLVDNIESFARGAPAHVVQGAF